MGGREENGWGSFEASNSSFSVKIRRIFRIPGSEPILLDLEKLFLLSDSMDSIDKTKFFEKTIFQKN